MGKEANIKVTVIMPVYNTGEYLKAAVESILSQSLKEFELILVDDGSTDGSSERCDEYARHDSRVVVIHQKNGGICNARNAALTIAKGEYIAFCDHDDRYLPNLLECAYSRAKETNTDILKFCKQEEIIINGKVVRKSRTFLEDKTYKKVDIQEKFLYMLNGNILECVWDALFRKDFLLENSIVFDEKYIMGGEDIDIVARIMTKANVFTTMNDCFYLHYVRSGFSTSSKFNIIKLENCKKLADRIYKSMIDLEIDLIHFKGQYVYQIMFTLIDIYAAILSNPMCTMSEREKYSQLKALKNERCITEWFFNVSTLSIFKISKKVGLSFFLYKMGMYRTMLMMFSLRRVLLNYMAK